MDLDFIMQSLWIHLQNAWDVAKPRPKNFAPLKASLKSWKIVSSFCWKHISHQQKEHSLRNTGALFPLKMENPLTTISYKWTFHEHFLSEKWRQARPPLLRGVVWSDSIDERWQNQNACTVDNRHYRKNEVSVLSCHLHNSRLKLSLTFATRAPYLCYLYK